MAQFNCFQLIVLVGIFSQRLAVANDEAAPPIPASADPCVLGTILVVHYPGFGDDCGETVNLDLVYEGEPTLVSFAAADTSKMYTLMMVDPDAPDAIDPQFAYYLHWLVVNIAGTDLANGIFANGDALTPYEHPLPPEGSGFHRYQFFVFAQASHLTIDAPNGRGFFDVGAFMTSNNLADPVAGYQYLTEEPRIWPGLPTVKPATTEAPATTASTPAPIPKDEATATAPVVPDDEATATAPVVPDDEATATTPVVPDDEATATTPAAGAAILKGNKAVLVLMAIVAVFQIAR
ncbi:OV-16 antigen-like isoform X2 [Asterias rubens]|uniref:OV-16 antigen-like isoform X2 n=1 Tax=Asterias rubens TaxID=7604 RepID=UPI001454F714|nr:OV-16 antigen-like isoform X2 [Asterias rubens]